MRYGGTKVPPFFEMKCNRCGRCCLLANPRKWTESKLFHQIDKSLPDISQIPLNKNGGCEMLIFNKDGTTSCALELYFGYQYKPEKCKKYPDKFKAKKECKNLSLKGIITKEEIKDYGRKLFTKERY